MEEEVLYLKSETYENRLVRIVLGVSREEKSIWLSQHSIGKPAIRATTIIYTPYSDFHADSE